jgi:CubicO group peptidase (beta-lactamase class C family)
MNRDLEQAQQTGVFKHLGLAIGVVRHGVRRVFTYGAAKPDSIFEIASVTKTFTALLLARMVEEGKVTLDEPVRLLLPPGTVEKPKGGEITLLDLATHHGGTAGLLRLFAFYCSYFPGNGFCACRQCCNWQPSAYS